MKPITDPRRISSTEPGHDLRSTFLHLGLGATVTPVPDFDWTPEFLDDYMARFADDGREGRLVGISPQVADWATWEQHPNGEEVVILLSGRADLVQLVDGVEHRVRLEPGQAAINPAGVWHTADVHEPGEILFITSGRGTQHAPRDAGPPGAG